MNSRNNSSYSARKKSSLDVESLDSNDFDDEGFIEGDINIGRSVASFSFGGEITIDSKKPKKQEQHRPTPYEHYKESEFHMGKPTQRGITPPVDGEQYTVKRCYQYRPSTVRKLNELKAKHPDVNVYLNTIIDEAINHYYNFIFSDSGN